VLKNIFKKGYEEIRDRKRFPGRHLLTFESQKLNYFGKKGGPAF
jgi:hypothetical protein